MRLAREHHAALGVVASGAATTVVDLFRSLTGRPSSLREQLLEGVPEVVAHFTLGSSALAADFYDDERERAGAAGRFVAEPIVWGDDLEKFRARIAWSVEPLFDGDQATTEDRLAEVVKFETAQANRDTVLENRRRDPESVGWRRVASSDACKFCQMLAARGAVYRHDTVRFAAHGKKANGSGGTCKCTAWPAFRSNDDGVSADMLQYVASRRKTTPAQRARIREYLNEHYPDAPG